MVRFKVNYGAHISRNFQYIDYDKLKSLLHEGEEESKSLLQPVLLTATTGNRKYTSSDFTAVFEDELRIVDNCYMGHMIDLDYAFVDTQRLVKEYSEGTATSKDKKKAQEAALKRSMSILYDKLIKLDTYRTLNRTAAIKILKKHDKIHKDNGLHPLLDSHMIKVGETNFGNGAKLNAMKSQIETLYADVFCGGILEEAQGKLLLAKTHTDRSIRMSVTFKAGIIITLLAWIAVYFLIAPRISLLYLTTDDPSIYVYAAVGALVIYRWFWGFSVYMWDSADIDYILILDLDANKHMPSCDEIFSDAANLTILYLLNVLIFHAMRYQHVHSTHNASLSSAAGFVVYVSARAYIMPILLVVGTLIRVAYSLTQPASYGVFSGKIVWSLVTAPLTPVQLRHSYAADIACSFVKVFSAMLYAGCYFTSGSYLSAAEPASAEGVAHFATCHSGQITAIKVVIYALPYWTRFLQCLRQRRDYFVRHQQQKKIHLAPADPSATSTAGAKLEMQLRSRRPSSTSNLQAPSADSGDGEDPPQRERVLSSDDDDEVRPFAELMEAGNGAALGVSDTDLNPGGIGSSRSECERIDSGTSAGVYGRPKPGGGVGAMRPKPAPLSRSESFDIPVPTLLRTLWSAVPVGCVPSLVTQSLQTMWIWPYSYNALRYFINICVIILGAYPPQDPLSSAYMSWYIPLCVISSLYGVYWDIANDFQLLQFHSSRPLLRDKILYDNNVQFYYFVLVVDPLLRFMWTLSFTPYGGHPFFVLFEIMRRSLWACLRMELGYIQELARRK